MKILEKTRDMEVDDYYRIQPTNGPNQFYKLEKRDVERCKSVMIFFDWMMKISY